MCGGIGESQFLADLARLYAVQYIPHAWGGALMLAATIQVLALAARHDEVAGVREALPGVRP